MLSATLLLVLGATFAHPSDGIVCETLEVPRWIGPRMRVIDTQVACYPAESTAPDPRTAELERLQAACNLLITAYGEEQGRPRCRALIRKAGVDFRD